MESERTIKHLIAGYVITVAILFATAPSTNAEKAERAFGDEPLSPILCFSFSILCFS